MKNNNHGQALVTLLFFMIIAITVTTGAIVIILTNSEGATSVSREETAYYAAEAGMENAVLRLLRDRTYTGETLPVGESQVQITVSGNNPYIATSSATLGNYVGKIEAQASYNNYILTVDYWKQIF